MELWHWEIKAARLKENGDNEEVERGGLGSVINVVTKYSYNHFKQRSSEPRRKWSKIYLNNNETLF